MMLYDKMRHPGDRMEDSPAGPGRQQQPAQIKRNQKRAHPAPVPVCGGKQRIRDRHVPDPEQLPGRCGRDGDCREKRGPDGHGDLPSGRLRLSQSSAFGIRCRYGSEYISAHPDQTQICFQRRGDQVADRGIVLDHQHRRGFNRVLVDPPANSFIRFTTASFAASSSEKALALPAQTPQRKACS